MQLVKKNSNWFKIAAKACNKTSCNDEKKLATKLWGNSKGNLRIRPTDQRLELVKMQMHLIRSGLNSERH